MTKVVVDTDVVSYVFKQSLVAAKYKPIIDSAEALVSFMTVAELERWTISSRWGDSRKRWLSLYLDKFTIVQSNPDMCRLWAELVASCRAVGRPIDTADAWVAATALLYDIPLITHNRRDYESIPNLRLISHI